MYKYLVSFVLLTPFIGIVFVESGEYASSVGIVGHPNGAAVAYACYAITVALVAWVSIGRPPRVARQLPVSPQQADAQLQVFSTNLLWVSGLFLLLFLFGFGAIQVWAGAIGKGEFRTGLGAFGAIPNLMTKFILPALLAYATALFRTSSKSRRLRWLLTANFALLFIIGASWGFKTNAIATLLPSLLLIYWRITIFQLGRLALLFVLIIVAFFYQFDSGVEAYADVQSFLFTRITVIQGDVAWYVWDKYVSGADLPNYWPTLLAVFGGKLLSLSGLSREKFFEWIHYHYDLLITYVADVPLDQIAGGHSITATPFAEGLVAGGIAGVVFFAVLAGLIVGRTYAFIRSSLLLGQNDRAAIAATYFCFYVFAWLNGGGVVQLVHISVWFALIATLLAFRAMKRLGRKATNIVVLTS